MNKWLLHDPAGVRADYTFEVNPNAMASPYLTRALAAHKTVIGGYRGLGRQAPHEWSFEGMLYTQAQYDQFAGWVDYASRVRLTDHVLRVWDVRLTKFDPVRAGTRQHPWRHRYTVTLTTYGGPL